MRPATLAAIATTLAAALLTGCGPTSQPDASQPDASQPEPSQPDARHPAAASVLRVVATGCDQPRHGTGFVVEAHGAPDGATASTFVVTAAHVVAGAHDVTLLDARDQAFAATDPSSVGGLATVPELRLVAFDAARDAAVLATSSPLDATSGGAPLTLRAAPDSLLVDEAASTATVVGYPRQASLEATAAHVVSDETTSVTDIYSAYSKPLRMLALSGEVAAGYSGAPVVGPGGSVWGMVVAVGRGAPARRLTVALSAQELEVVVAAATSQTHLPRRSECVEAAGSLTTPR